MSDLLRDRRLLAMAQDPGGAAALSPVLLALNECSEVSCRVLARAHAMRVFAGAGVPLDNFDDLVRSGENWQVCSQRILQEGRFDLVLTGTSFGPSPERAFIRASAQIGIPSFTLLDSWTNYRRRFLEPHETDLTADVLPGAIGVMNEFGKVEMEAHGFPPSVLHVVGQPAIDTFLSRARARQAAERNALRARFNVPRGEPILSYFSQPIEALYGSPGSPTFRGYTEHDVLDAVVEAVSLLPGRPALIVKPHAKESLARYERLVRAGAGWCLADDSDDTLVLGSDVVIGMTGVTLIKAFLIGRAVVSVQPNLQGEDQCVLARAGCIKTVAQQSALLAALLGALGRSSQTPSEEFAGCLVDGQAVARIRALLEKLMEGNS